MFGPRRSELTIWWTFSRLVVGAVFRLCFRLRYIGLGRVPRTGPVVLAANHVSALDGVILGLATLEGPRRKIRFLAGAEFFERPWLGFFLRSYQAIPLRRGARDTGALGAALETIRRGAVTGIFPEGHVGHGELQRGRSGVTRLALAASSPVVPVGIWGTQDRYPVEGLHWRRPWRPPLVVVFGDPIPADGDVRNAAQVRAFTTVVMDAIAEQLAIARRVAATMR